MDFDTSFKEDLPLLSTLLSQSPLKQEPTNNCFPLQSSLYKPMFQNSQDDNDNLLTTPPSGSNFNPSQSFDQYFFTQGSSSFEPFETHQQPKGFFKDLINSSSSFMPFEVFDHTTQNKLMHGSQIARGVWNHDNNPQAIIAIQKSMEKSHMYPSGTFRGFGTSSTGNGPLLLADDVSCNIIIAENGYKKKLVDQKKRRSVHMVIRKGGKSSKKSHIIKGQWIPREDK